MKLKFFSITIALILLIPSAIYFLMSHSYQLSLEAKFYYHMGEYEKARIIAKQAHEENRYNRMAATVMTQSNLALEYVVYNQDAKTYLHNIEAISKKKFIENADKYRMKFMAEIMIERFPKLTPTVVIDEDLKKQAAAYAKEFEKIREKIVQSL